ncbi:ABC transporter permease [Agrococcus sp. SL85]|uniref:ABC transporter permease n=1 Tax=Agrococcus sp. SL85 TaxID=2995141 RepID=UPI00226D09A9|nr:ABC transporter permease [Agrococcus sp. SL85]WAC66795.1 ABC transporter permease [Agrococcus sp. SL85]
MSAWLRMLRVVVGLELAQRVRSVAWYVLLGIVAVVVGGVIVTLYVGLAGFGQDLGGAIFATTIFFVMLVTSLVTPALSGNAINGDREAGVLASTQVTQVTATQLVLGKVLAAWIASLGFLAVCVPFMLWSALAGGLRLEVVLIAIPILVAEIGVVSAIGVGLSGLIRKPIMSTVVSYLVVAALSVGTLIGFAVGGLALTEEQQHPEITWEYDDTDPYDGGTCVETGDTYPQAVQRFDRVWLLLAANPYVMISDAIPPRFDAYGYPDDLFGQIALGVRQAQVPPQPQTCASYTGVQDPDQARAVYDGALPSWFVGLAIHVALGAAAVVGAIAANRTPARTLAPGSRIA